MNAGRWWAREIARPRRRGLCVLLISGLALTALPANGLAHPLGNFSINHQTRVKISRDRVDLLYILDQAEIPTLRERDLSRREVLDLKVGEARRNLWLIVNGRRRSLHLGSGARLSFPPGQGGLRITRVELPFTLKVKRARQVDLRDYTFEGRVGWTDIVSEPGRGTAVKTFVSPLDPTNRLRTYRGVSLKDVPEQRFGRFQVRSGKSTLEDLTSRVVYRLGQGEPFRRSGERADSPTGPSRSERQERRGPDRTGGDGFTGVFEDAANGEGLFVFMLFAAFGWGALHALSPGHGKAMVAAYLVGTRGTARHAISLGGIVTVTHTIGVFALGLVTLLLSQYILPEDLYPWLNLAAGLLIVAVGLGVLRSRLRWGRAQRTMAGPDAHFHELGEHGEHDHAESDDHVHRGHHHDREGHRHDDGSHHHVPEVTWKGLAGMGISAGLIPCPSALVVLLAAITQDEVGLGLLLLVVFSLGLAFTLSALGLAVVYAKRLTARLSSRFSYSSRLVALLPAASTFVILGLGIVLTAKALPQIT